MSDRSKEEVRAGPNIEAGDDLRQALMRLTSPQVEALWNELSRLEQQIEALRKLEGDTTQLRTLLLESHSTILEFEKNFRLLGDELREPTMVKHRMERALVPVLREQVEDQSEEVAEALAPVIGPAIRYQIANAKDDIINALYPLIGQIIGKAISESLRELTRNIDSRLRQQLNIRDRFNHLIGRLQGVSAAELVLRNSLPFKVEHIFLIHRETGILLKHLIVQGREIGDMRSVSGMLTAIQDFVRDSFSGGEGNLEEIAHGDLRILLESGPYAYIAVVVDGVEPVGFSNQISDVVHTINLKFEKEIKNFDGDMGKLPELTPILDHLRVVESGSTADLAPAKPLPPAQRRIIGIGVVSLIFILILLIFACIFVIRLWPVVFTHTLPAISFM